MPNNSNESTQISSGFVTALENIEKSLRGIESAMKPLTKLTNEWLKEMESLTATLFNGANSVMDFIVGVDESKKVIKDLPDGVSKLAKTITSYVDENKKALVVEKLSAVAKKAASLTTKDGVRALHDQVTALNKTVASKIKETASTYASVVADKIKNIEINKSTVSIGLHSAASAIATAATQAWTFATGLLTAAIKLLSGPIGWIVAGVAALATGLVFLVAKLTSSAEAVAESKKEMEGFREANEELKGSMEESAEAYKDSQNAIEGSSRVTEGLLDELIALDAEMKSGKGDVDAMRAKVAQLNDAEEGLNLAFDEGTKSLSMTTDEIMNYINAVKKMSGEDAIINRMSELTDELSAVESEIYALEKVQEGYQRMLGEGTISQSEYNKMLAGTKVELENLKGTQKTVTNEMTALNGEYIDSIASKSEAEKVAAKEQRVAIYAMANEYHMSYNKIAEDMESSGKTAAEYKDANIKALEENRAAVEGYASTWGMSTPTQNSGSPIFLINCCYLVSLGTAWLKYRKKLNVKKSHIKLGREVVFRA